MIRADDTHDVISHAALQLLLKEPFYAHLLASMPREVGERVETAAVAWDGSQVRLIVNPRFFSSLASDEERVAILKHELLHVVFRHLFRQAGRNPQIENIAADLVVNQLVAPWPLPTTAVTLGSFPDLGLEADQSLEYYYERLTRLRGPVTFSGATGQAAASPPQRPGCSDATEPAALGRHAAPRSAAELNRLLATGGRGDHALWSSDTSRSATAAQFAVEEIVLRARDRLGAEGWGTLPAAVREVFAGIAAMRQPTIQWRRALRLFATATGGTRIRHTMRKPSKRYGTTPGIKVQRSRRVLVALDTSGSISNDAFVRFFVEIDGIWRSGASITIVECDAAVTAVYFYKGVIPSAVTGRGGTAFDPLFKWMRERPRFDGCIYFTDGVAADPVTKPSCPLLWVQSQPRVRPLPYGRTVLLGE